MKRAACGSVKTGGMVKFVTTKFETTAPVLIDTKISIPIIDIAYGLSTLFCWIQMLMFGYVVITSQDN